VCNHNSVLCSPIQSTDFCCDVIAVFQLVKPVSNWVLGQNGSGQNGTDKMVWTNWYTDKMVLDKMVRTKWYGQNGTILYFVYILIPLNSIYI